MPGRTPKSLQHQWAKIKSLVAELENGGGQPAKKNVKGTSASCIASLFNDTDCC